MLLCKRQRLKVIPLSEETITLLVVFKEIGQTGEAVKNIVAEGIIPMTLEFLDSEAVKAVENYKPVGLPEDAAEMLLIEIDGQPQAIQADAEKVSDICTKLNGEIIMAENELARARLWEARRAVSPALYHLSPAKINEDIVVPRNRIAEMLRYLRKMSEETGIKIVNFGHAGDGNIHVNLMVDRNKKEEYEKAVKLIREIFSKTLELGGTISGEHGIGLTKLNYISMEIPPEELALMKKIKIVFDPKNILNPGKIFP